MDQIKLWEAEGRRAVPFPGYLYDNFESAALFDASLAHARRLGVLTWASPGSAGGGGAGRAYAVTAEGHGAMKEHIRALKAAAAQQQQAVGGGGGAQGGGGGGGGHHTFGVG